MTDVIIQLSRLLYCILSESSDADYRFEFYRRPVWLQRCRLRVDDGARATLVFKKHEIFRISYRGLAYGLGTSNDSLAGVESQVLRLLLVGRTSLYPRAVL